MSYRNEMKEIFVYWIHWEIVPETLGHFIFTSVHHKHNYSKVENFCWDIYWLKRLIKKKKKKKNLVTVFTYIYIPHCKRYRMREKKKQPWKYVLHLIFVKQNISINRDMHRIVMNRIGKKVCAKGIQNMCKKVYTIWHTFYKKAKY